MPPQEFLSLFVFYTFAFKNKCMRSLHPVRSSFTSEPSHQSVNVGLYGLSKKRKVVACVTIYKKLTSEELKVTGTRPVLANQ